MICIKFLIILIPVLINESCCLNLCRRKFTIVVDGGSTGTRLHFFEFTQMGKITKLNITDRISSKVALSKFSNARADWGLMRIMFNNITAFAMSKIPSKCYNSTPIYVQVTAGVRQIEQAMSTRILNHVKDILLTSRFKFSRNFVDILTTEKEGRLAWVSVNFLLKKLQNNKCLDTVGMLDLGGGSTQISFATIDKDLIPKSKKMILFGQQYYVYSGGYDYMGIDETRIKYLKASHCIGLICQNQIMRSECLHPNVTANFHFGNRSLVIGGKPFKRERFFDCVYNGVDLVLRVYNIRNYIRKMEFVAISAYYYIIKSAFNIKKKAETDLMTYSLTKIINRAKEICQNPKNETDNFKHFQCLDMTYIIALLSRGYRFEEEDEIKISRRIKKISLSWALGYAITKL